MASVSKFGSGIKVRFDGSDWMSGIIPDYNASGTDYRIGRGFTLVDSVDPYRVPNYIMPGTNPTDATNIAVVDAVLKNGAVDGNFAYMTSAGAKLFELVISTNTLTTPTTFPHTISAHGGHSTVVGEDVAIYHLDGTKYLFYSWNDGTNGIDGSFGRYNLDTTFDDDYLKTLTTATSGTLVVGRRYRIDTYVAGDDFENVGSSASPATGDVFTAIGTTPTDWTNGSTLVETLSSNPHPMIVGDDDILYVGDGNNLASLQGTTAAGIWNASALDLPTDYVITSFSKTPNYLVIYAYKKAGGTGSNLKTESTAFFWGYASSSWSYATPLPGNYVNGGFTFNGNAGCFVQGQSADAVSARQSKCILVSPGGVQEVTDFNGDIPGHGGVEVSGQSIMWNTDGDIYRYGSPYRNLPPSLNFITETSGSTSEGMLKNFFNTSLLASAGTTTSGGLQTFTQNYNTGSLFTAQKLLPTQGKNGWRIDYVRVQYLDTISASGRGFAIKVSGDSTDTGLDAHGSITTLYDSSTDSATIDKLVKIYTLDSDGNNLPRIDTSVGLVMTWGSESPADASDAPKVESVEVYLVPTRIPDVN